jgi:DNA topoisomerase VI subunit B
MTESVINNQNDSILSRSRTLEYVNEQGLCALTGCQKNDFDIWILKELIDNALDACDTSNVDPRIQVKITRNNNIVIISVEDNGTGITREDLFKILDFTRFTSSKYFLKKPQRGFMGSAIKAIIGISFALKKIHGQVPPVILTSRSLSHTINLEVTPLDNVKVNIDSVKADVTGTIVKVPLPALNEYWGWNNQYLELVKSFSIFNPTVRFSISLQKEQDTITREYPEKETPLKTFKGKPSIHWSTLDEFRRHIKALETSPMSVDQFISSFFGYSTKTRRHELLDSIKLASTTSLNELNVDKIDSIYHEMTASREPPKPNSLTRIGEKALLAKVTSVYGKPLKYKYKSITTNYVMDGVYYPSRVEIVVAAMDENTLPNRKIIVGVNQTPTLRNPLFRTLFTRNKKKDIIYYGVYDLIEGLHIKKMDPVLILIHISTPNPSYEDYGKTHLNISPFLSSITKELESASSFYYQFKRGGVRKFGEKSKARKILVKKLERRVRLRQELGYVPDEERVTMQTLYYQTRKTMGGDTGIKRDSFIAAIKPECETLGYKRLQLGIITTVRAELHFRGKDYPISYENLNMLAELGSDIIVVEKEGISLALSSLADKYGVALLTSRGFLVEYAHELIELMRNKKANLYLLTDYDAPGISISAKVPTVPRIGIDFNTHIELGLNYDSVVEKYRPKPNVLRDVPHEHRWFLSNKRIEIDSILSEAGQWKFWLYLMKKMMEISPIRDLTRSISFDVNLPDEVMKYISRIKHLLAEPSDDLKAFHMHRLENWSKGFVPIEEIENEILMEFIDRIRASKRYRAVMRYLDETASVLESYEKTEK